MPSIYIPYKSPEFLARMKPLDDGLEELCLLQIGRPLAQRDIAEFCGVSQNLISRVEKRALKKVRCRLREIGIQPEGRYRGFYSRAVINGLA